MPDLLPVVRKLRNNPTDAEKKLWFAINREQLGVRFRRQYSVCGYVADFICVPRKLIIEVDGGQHSESADAGRTAVLESSGYHVLRFWNNEVLQNTDGVLQVIVNHLKLTSS